MQLAKQYQSVSANEIFIDQELKQGLFDQGLTFMMLESELQSLPILNEALKIYAKSPAKSFDDRKRYIEVLVCMAEVHLMLGDMEATTRWGHDAEDELDAFGKELDPEEDQSDMDWVESNLEMLDGILDSSE